MSKQFGIIGYGRLSQLVFEHSDALHSMQISYANKVMDVCRYSEGQAAGIEEALQILGYIEFSDRLFRRREKAKPDGWL